MTAPLHSQAEVREQVRDAMRDAVDAARDAAREAAREAQGVVPGTPVTTPIDGNFVLQVLQSEIAATREEVASLTARLGVGSPRQQELVEAQLSQANARLESLQGRLDALVSGEATAPFPGAIPPDFPPGLDGDRIERMARMGTEGFFITVVTLAIGIPLVRAFGRWLDRRGTPATAPDVTGRLDRIEQALDSVAVEVERISEGQRYSSKMLGELRALPAPDPMQQWSARPREAERVRHTTPV